MKKLSHREVMWLTHGHTAGKWEKQGFGLGKVAKCGLNHGGTGLEFNEVVLSYPCLLFWTNILIFYLDGDKINLFFMFYVSYTST